MSRLIKEKDIVKHAQKASEIYEQDAEYMVVGLGYIYSAPEAKLELIRCSDCKYGELDMLDQGYMEPPICEGIICTKHKGLYMDFTDYCSYGERKDGER